MKRKKSIANTIVWSVLIFCGICVLIRFAIDAYLVWEGGKDIKYYPERVSAREFVASESFSLLWSKKTEGGSQHLVYTQIFVPDNKNMVYITPNSMNSLDFLTGDLLWSTEIPEDRAFHFYDDKIFSVDSYDVTV